jgi:hypothetical protein
MVRECFITSIEISNILQQPYTLVTMDLEAAKIAYGIINSSQEFSNVILNQLDTLVDGTAFGGQDAIMLKV